MNTRGIEIDIEATTTEMEIKKTHTQTHNRQLKNGILLLLLLRIIERQASRDDNVHGTRAKKRGKNHRKTMDSHFFYTPQHFTIAM